MGVIKSTPHTAINLLSVKVDYALQDHTCFVCTKSLCMNCHTIDTSDEDVDYFLDRCDTCNKTLCEECSPVSYCLNCQRSQCTGCGLSKCDTCGKGICGQCFRKCEWCNRSRCSSCTTFYECKGKDCNKKHCRDCRDDNHRNVEDCLTCSDEFCFDCRLTGCVKGLNSCGGCLSTVAWQLAHDYKEKEERLAPEKCTCRNTGLFSCKTCDFKCKKKDCDDEHCSDCGICGEEDIINCESHETRPTCFECRVNCCNQFPWEGRCKTCMKDVIQKLSGIRDNI